MTRSVLLGALAVISGAVVFAVRQAGTAAPLSNELRAHVKGEQFGAVTAMRGLPLGVREALQGLFGSATLDIADPGAPFQGSAPVPDPALPTRRLAIAGCSVDHCLVYYERAGNPATWHAALFHWTPAETRLEAGGVAARGFTSVNDIRNAVLSGALKAPDKVW